MKSKIVFAALTALCISAVLIVRDQKLPNFRTETENEEKEYEEEEEKEGHQSGADKQLQTWFWQKGYPNPENLGGKYMKAWDEYLEIKENTRKLLGANNTRTTGFGNWSTVGTSVANIGGRVVCIAIDPNNPNTNLFIGTASGGIYKTINGGSNWTYVPTGKPVLGIGAITYHPTNSNILLAGTGEVYRVTGTDQGNVGFNVWKCRGTYGIGILRSTDGGATWTQAMTKTSNELFAIQSIMYNPSNANEVFACATDGLYKSTDGGATWSTTPFFSKTYVRDIAINPANPLQMVISVGNLVNTDKGLYRTTNGGSVWTKITGLPSTMTGYTKLDNNGSRLYAAFGIAGTADELYMSTDFGATWIAKTGSDHTGGQYWFAHTLAVDPGNADRVIMGGVNYFTYTSTNSTTNAGTKASISTTMHSDVHDIKFHPTNNQIVYVANDGGMYKSTNGGGAYAAINTGLNAVQFYASFAVSPTDPNIMIGGLQDNGVVKFNGTSWSSILGGDGGPSMFHPKNGNKVLYSNDARAVFFSADAGATETQELLNLGYGYASAYDDRTAFMSPVGMSYPTTTANGIVMYVASDNLHISLDSGTTFSRASPTGTGTAGMTRPIDATYKPAIALGVSQANRNKVYVSTSPLSQRADDGLNVTPPAKVLVSTNASDNVNYSFTDISTSLPDRFTTDFAISKFSDDSIYITMGGFGSGHVYLSPDGGTTWLNRSTNLPNVPFNAIVIDPVRPNVIYAACDFGVYVSANRGVSWYDFNAGLLENTMVMDLQITADKQIVAATHGKGVYKSPLFIPPATLPVTFQTFTGIKKATENELTWFVNEERNLNKYEVERSTDGVHFSRIATVSARNAGNTSTYVYADRSQQITAPVLYYRLKAIDVNNTYLHSDVVMLKNEKSGKFKVLGNPFTSHISFKYESTVTAKMFMQVADMGGRVLQTNSQSIHPGTGYYTINNLGNVAAGQYLLRIQVGNEIYTEKLIKR
ncbi:MAG TPA: T9SS type A sorting domain-containing protein [Flavisolibacter sp.]